jgi:hypothetical protein
VVEGSKMESVPERIRRLQEEARREANSHVGSLCREMDRLQSLASEIAGGGDAYPPGVRDLARRLAEDLDSRSQSLGAIVSRMRS